MIDNTALQAAIAYFEDAVRESDEIIEDCSPDLQRDLTEQKAHFVVALEAMRRAEPANEPLTLERLRGMDGEPVWVAESGNWNGGQGVVISADDGVFDPNETDGYWPFEYYGEWLAYRRKPEPEGEEDV